VEGKRIFGGLGPYTLFLLDIWLQVSRPSCRAYETHYKHSRYVPVKEGRVVIKDLPPGKDYHLKARFILPDSTRSSFSEVSV
jgi:hypothetical protein